MTSQSSFIFAVSGLIAIVAGMILPTTSLPIAFGRGKRDGISFAMFFVAVTGMTSSLLYDAHGCCGPKTFFDYAVFTLFAFLVISGIALAPFILGFFLRFAILGARIMFTRG